jgi:hypothetical protein
MGTVTGRVRMRGENKNQHQRMEAGYVGVLFGRLGATIARWGWFGGLWILVHT